MAIEEQLGERRVARRSGPGVAHGRAGQRRDRLALLLALVVLPPLVAACSDSTGGWVAPASAPASVTDRSRDAQLTNDFLRTLFVPAGVVPDRLGLPSALRVFATASVFFEPALTAAEVADYPGLPYREDQDMVAMRCSPPGDVDLDPILATWPNALAAIGEDLGPYACPPPDASPENQVYCIAREYVDVPDAVVSATLLRALEVGALLFATPERADVLRRRFGMYPAFSGLGFAVKGTGDGAAMRAKRALRDSIVPEYLIRNATLADAGCYCLIVPPYEGRAADPLDVDYVAQAGGFGECRPVDRLRPARQP